MSLEVDYRTVPHLKALTCGIEHRIGHRQANIFRGQKIGLKSTHFTSETDQTAVSLAHIWILLAFLLFWSDFYEIWMNLQRKIGFYPKKNQSCQWECKSQKIFEIWQKQQCALYFCIKHVKLYIWIRRIIHNFLKKVKISVEYSGFFRIISDFNDFLWQKIQKAIIE